MRTLKVFLVLNLVVFVCVVGITAAAVINTYHPESWTLFVNHWGDVSNVFDGTWMIFGGAVNLHFLQWRFRAVSIGGVASDVDDYTVFREADHAGTNPSTGLPMINAAIDVSGTPFGCNPPNTW